MPFLDVVEHEVDMDEVSLQAQCPDKHECLVHPFWGAAEDAVEQQNACHGERNVEHSFQEERKMPMFHLFQEDACKERHQEHQPYHPDACPIERVLLSHHLTHVDADEEDGHSAPEDLQMSYGLVDRCDVLHKNAPHNHDYGQPTVDGVSLDEFHIARSEEVEHHRGWDIPEVELVMQPEPPVDGDFSEEVDPIPSASAMETRDIEKAGYDEPRWINAEITADKEPLGVWVLHPGEPQADATEEEKHIHSHVAHSAQAKESIVSWQTHMKENDEEHGCSHQLTAKSTDIR